MSIFEDEVHGKIELTNLETEIINTLLFQRLKEIKQLGCALYYFPATNHSRYEHCIGTCFLAKKMLKCLSQNSSTTIPGFYQKCVYLAALLHDVGHGPFSHFWEHSAKSLGAEYCHEDNGTVAVDKIFANKVLRLDEADDRHEYGVTLIKAMIVGDKSKLSIEDEHFGYLFEIVNNSECGIDVDKWDYLQRDYFYAKSYLNDVQFDERQISKIFTSARISPDRFHVEYDKQNFEAIYNMFDLRFNLHKNLYQNPNVRIKEKFLFNAFQIFQNKNFKFFGKDLFEITCKDDQFLELTDDNVIKMLGSVKDNEINFYLSLLTKEIKLQKLDKNFCVEINIPNAGITMKEEKIPFYGNFVENIEKIRKNIKKDFHKNLYYFNII